MKFFLHFITVLCLVALAFSCSNEQPHKQPKERIFKGYDVSLDSVIRNQQGIIRGLELGAKIGEVKAAEPNLPVEFDVDYYYYEGKVDSLTSYSVAYTFVHDSLDEIEIKIHSLSLDAGATILNDIKKYYQQKYTAPLMDQGVYVFNCFDSRKRNFKLSLSDNSGIDMAHISLLVYREK
ncbi:MAG: hypothetical protein ACJ76F_11960 [Bacteroidia bacterium]